MSTSLKKSKKDRIPVSVWIPTHTKLQKLAESDGRTLVKQIDVIADEALTSRGLKSKTKKS